jgi:hypothetical protein
VIAHAGQLGEREAVGGGCAAEHAGDAPAWVSEGLIRATCELFTREYRRPVGRAEAVGMIVRAAALGEIARGFASAADDAQKGRRP